MWTSEPHAQTQQKKRYRSDVHGRRNHHGSLLNALIKTVYHRFDAKGADRNRDRDDRRGGADGLRRGRPTACA